MTLMMSLLKVARIKIAEVKKKKYYVCARISSRLMELKLPIERKLGVGSKGADELQGRKRPKSSRQIAPVKIYQPLLFDMLCRGASFGEGFLWSLVRIR